MRSHGGLFARARDDCEWRGLSYTFSTSDTWLRVARRGGAATGVPWPGIKIPQGGIIIPRGGMIVGRPGERKPPRLGGGVAADGEGAQVSVVREVSDVLALPFTTRARLAAKPQGALSEALRGHYLLRYQLAGSERRAKRASSRVPLRRLTGSAK